jgi:hypothetical protein
MNGKGTRAKRRCWPSLVCGVSRGSRIVHPTGFYGTNSRHEGLGDRKLGSAPLTEASLSIRGQINFFHLSFWLPPWRGHGSPEPQSRVFTEF